MINEGTATIGIYEVNSNWSKIPTKENSYNRTDGWFRKRSISKGYNRVTNSDGTFQSGGTSIMTVYEISRRAIATGQELRNLGC